MTAVAASTLVIACGAIAREVIAITQANQVWALDTTYIPMAKGFDYFDCYNTYRPHSKLEWLTPQEKYVATLPKLRLTA